MEKSGDKPIFKFFLLTIIFFIPFISSAPPFTTTTGNTLSIEHPYQETIKAGEDYYFHFHVYNISDNYKSPNMSLTTCSFHLYGRINNTNGRHIFKNNFKVGSDDVLDWEQIIKGGNFTKNNCYGFVFECNSSNERGGYENTFCVTENGDAINTGTGIIYFLVTLFAFSIFLGLTILFISIKGGNDKNESTGEVISINSKKYIKIALFPLVYVSFIWFFNFIIGLTNNYLGLTLYSNTLGFIFEIMMKLVWPIIIITFIVELIVIIKDSNIRKEISIWTG